MRIIYKLKKLFRIPKKKAKNNKMMFEKINFLISELETLQDEKNLFLLEYAIITLQNNKQLLNLFKNKLKKNKNISIEIKYNENISYLILRYNFGGVYGCKRVS